MAEVPSQFLVYLKENFEKNIAYFLGHPSRMELDVVVDSSSIIADMLSLVRKGKSKLRQLMKEPFVRFHAPTILKTEVESKMDKWKKDKQLLMQTWQTDFLPNIRLKDPKNLIAWIKGFITVGRRDEKDIPFVALHFEMRSQGIITRDKDIIEQPQIRTWKLGRLGNVVTIFKKGSFSFFVFSKLLPAIFYVLFQIGVAVFLGLATFVFVLYDKTRNAALDFLKKVSEEFCRFAFKLYENIKSLLSSLAPIVNVAIVVLTYLFQTLEEAINQIRSIKMDILI